MVHLAVNALAGTDVPLGIVPVGTGNDTSRGLGIDRRSVDAAVDQFLAATALAPRTVDLGRIEFSDGRDPVWFAGALSAGFDALVNERANSWRWPRGRLRYNLAIARELATLKHTKYSLMVDGEPEEPGALLISISNGSSIGGGMKITPDARYDDGLLDLFVVAPVSRGTFMAIFPRVFSGRHTTHPAVDIRRVAAVSIDAVSAGAMAGSIRAAVASGGHPRQCPGAGRAAG